jgi:hypothetical protein
MELKMVLLGWLEQWIPATVLLDYRRLGAAQAQPLER